MSFDGSDFVGLDEDLVDNVADSNSARPLDAMLEWSLRHNARYLIELGHRVSLVPFAANAGTYTTVDDERPIAGQAGGTQLTSWLWPWLYQAGATTIEASAIAAVGDQEGAQNLDFNMTLVPYRLDSRLSSGGGGQAIISASTEGSTPIHQDHTASLDLVTIEQAYVAPLQLRVTSFTGSTVIDQVTFPTTQPFTTGGSAVDADSGDTYYTDTTATRPNTDALDIQVTRFNGASTAGEDGTGDFDHLWTDDGDVMVMAPQPPEPYELSKRYISYMHLRGLEIHTTFEDTTLQPDDVLRAKQAVVGEVEQTHLIRRDSLYRRARPKWLGPEGYVPATEAGWPGAYTGRWPRVYGDNTDTPLFSANVFLDSTSPRLKIMAYVLGYETLAVGTAITGDNYAEALAERAGAATWLFDVQGYQLEDGDADWTAATSIVDTTSDTDKVFARVTHYPTEVSGASPFLRQAATYESSLQEFTFKEGLLYPEDLTALRPLLIDVEVPVTYTVTDDVPVRIDLIPTVTTTASDVPENVSVELASSQASASSSDFALVCIGASIWELPQ